MPNDEAANEIIWTDGDIMDSYQELLEHLWCIGELEGPDNDGIYTFHGGRFAKTDLLVYLQEIVAHVRDDYEIYAKLLGRRTRERQLLEQAWLALRCGVKCDDKCNRYQDCGYRVARSAIQAYLDESLERPPQHGMEATLTAASLAFKEFVRTRNIHRPYNSAHEGWAVIHEEVDELWDEVRKRVHDSAAMQEEAIQVAATAMRFIADVCLPDSSKKGLTRD